MTGVPPWDELQVIDHHCHSVVRGELDGVAFTRLISESDGPAASVAEGFDSQLGLAVRRWCAPVLDLEPHARPETYLARRLELGSDEVNRRFLRGAGVAELLVDNGFRADDLISLRSMAELAGAVMHEVVRLETVAEDLVGSVADGEEFWARYPQELRDVTRNAVGVKSIIAYRDGLDFEPSRPSREEVIRAVDAWLVGLRAGGVVRLTNSSILRFLLWSAVDLGRPIQFHVGFGDATIDLHRCHPALMTDFIRATQSSGTKIVLLHCYPYHREAGYLAHIYPHVFMDVGLAMNYSGVRASTLLAEAWELAPFGKVLYSSDAFGLPELHYLGAKLFEDSLVKVLDGWLDDGAIAPADTERIARLITRENACAVYGLPFRSTRQ